MVHGIPIWRVQYCRAKRTRQHFRFVHGLHLPGGDLCADPLILALPIPYRYGAVVQHIGSILAGPECSPADADRFAEDFFHINITYWPSAHGIMPVVCHAADLQRVAKCISLPTTYTYYPPQAIEHPSK